MTQQGRFVVTLFYLLILVVCFVVPLFYYFRICCEVRREQRLLRRTELETIRAAMEQSVGSSTTAVNRAETLAMKKKYMEEKKARILQLLGPVRLVREQGYVAETIRWWDIKGTDVLTASFLFLSYRLFARNSLSNQ